REPPVTAGALDQLAVAWLTMFVVGSDLFVVSPLLPLIAADYAVPPAAAGWSVTVFAVTYMLSAPALGHIADRVGRGRVLTYCLCAFGAANLLTAIADNFTWLLVTRFFAGAAAAGSEEWCPARRAIDGACRRRAACSDGAVEHGALRRLHLPWRRAGRIGLFGRGNRTGDPVLWWRSDCRHLSRRAPCRPPRGKT